VENLNKPQTDAAKHKDGPLIIFAGAGTGKTRVIVHRIANLVESGVSPHNILAVTFTNKAAEEMKKRVNALVPGTGANVWVSTFHSFCAYFLRVEAVSAGLSKDFLIYDYGEQKNVIKDIARDMHLDEKKFKPSTIADKISRAKDDLLTPEALKAQAAETGNFFTETIAGVYDVYQKRLKASDALDFGDLIMKTVEALSNNAALLEKYQNRFQYILVDEYQDTNHAQYMLAKLLALKHKNICVVGDDDQSVYSWRGANIGNILDFERDYENCVSIKLEQNYRSTPKILNAAYNVIKHNSERVKKQLWTENADDGSVSVIKSSSENDEAAKIADMISLKTYGGKSSYNDFAVFYRTNAQSRVFEDAFRRNGIPYVIIGSLKFYDRAEVKDIMAYLKLIHNPNDNVSFKRVVNVPKRSVGKTSIEKLERIAIEKGVSLWQAVNYITAGDIARSAVFGLNAFKNLIEGFIMLKNAQTVKDIAQGIINATGYMKELEAEATPEAKSKIENLQELISAIDDFERRSPDKSLTGYLTQIALISDIDDLEEDDKKITLMTLHLAKGLEFKTVFLCGLEEGLFPIGESAFDPSELEEERRLMYVGMTRAMEHLYLSWAQSRTVYGKTRWNMPSRFIAEAGFTKEFSGTPKFRQQPFSSRAKVEYKQANNEDLEFNQAPPDDNEDYGEPLYTPAKDASPYAIGVAVSHPVFGNGKIIEKFGTGDDLKLVVLFENGQRKKLLARVANLAVI
jgi:DNA helicase-2/ATP-dependent DNA helicase PcrA